MNLETIRDEMDLLKNPAKKEVLQRFFKTAPGEYAEGDIFIGITVPQLRTLAQRFLSIDTTILHVLLCSQIHEERFLALLILVYRYNKADKSEREWIFSFYCEHLHSVNNWDLVDTSADKIIGHYIYDKKSDLLFDLISSSNLWYRRIAIVASFYFIKQNRFDETLALSEHVLDDPEPLIHKATGWMLREVGKRDLSVEQTFLRKHYRTMPRTMLRYAIERFPEELRQAYLKGSI